MLGGRLVNVCIESQMRQYSFDRIFSFHSHQLYLFLTFGKKIKVIFGILKITILIKLLISEKKSIIN